MTHFLSYEEDNNTTDFIELLGVFNKSIYGKYLEKYLEPCEMILEFVIEVRVILYSTGATEKGTVFSEHGETSLGCLGRDAGGGGGRAEGAV